MKLMALGDRWSCNKRLLARVLIVNTAIALVPPFLMLALGLQMTGHRLFESFCFSLVYAQCIGSLAFAAMPKLWVATLGSSPWLRWALRIMAMFATSLAGGMIACLIFVALGWIPLQLYWTEFNGSLKIATFLTVLAGGTISMYASFQARLDETTLQLRTKELERERALKLATAAQLASLESRIHPHFLFNTLNSISSLIQEDPKRAEKLVEQMAALLRFSLDSNHSGLVPLAREMKIVADYLDIERARFGDRLRFHIDVAPGLDEAKVPPLAIQTLVENSVKHAVSRSRSGGEIRVTGARDNGSLCVQVLDEGPEFRLEAAPCGHGLDNLKGRLATLFGQQGGLALERHGNWNQMTLSVPQSA
jgi:two-component system, LytTR family, sensor histidine kinase AlgZ